VARQKNIPHSVLGTPILLIWTFTAQSRIVADFGSQILNVERPEPGHAKLEDAEEHRVKSLLAHLAEDHLTDVAAEADHGLGLMVRPVYARAVKVLVNEVDEVFDLLAADIVSVRQVHILYVEAIQDTA
jgi:hypothetical protein